MSNKITRPIMRWHGGKWKLAPWIIAYFPKHKVYVEPYGGGGSVLLRKPRAYAEVYNDLDEQAVNLFKVVRDCGQELEAKLRLTPFSRKEFENALDHHGLSPIERARLTLCRAYMGFGSAAVNQATGFRYNSNRSGTTPAHDWANYPNCLNAIIERLQGVVIENRDAQKVMTTHDGKETLHYIDPPYVKSTRSDSGDDYAFEMSDSDHQELIDFIQGLKGKVVLSGYENDIYNQLGWRKSFRQAHADGALKRKEILWMNFEDEGDLFSRMRFLEACK